MVIEDDDDVRHLVCTVLGQSGFEVHAAAGGRDGVEAVQRKDAVVVTLDIGLPDIDGFEVLRRIRRFSDCYVIMLTGREDELDTLTALQAGADDYLTKPFRPRELRARMEAMLRRPRMRTYPQPRPAQSANHSEAPASGPVAGRRTHPEILEHNGLSLNPRTRSAALPDAELVLTRSEFDLLHELMRGGGTVCTKVDLVKALRGDAPDQDTYVSDADERAIDFHIGNLRRKLGENRQAPRWLQTVRGVGYRLAPERAE